MIIEVLKQDLYLVLEEARFHFFHKWSKWYRVKINYGTTENSFFSFVEQQKHCLICNKIKRASIPKTSCQ